MLVRPFNSPLRTFGPRWSSTPSTPRQASSRAEALASRLADTPARAGDVLRVTLVLLLGPVLLRLAVQALLEAALVLVRARALLALGHFLLLVVLRVGLLAGRGGTGVVCWRLYAGMRGGLVGGLTGAGGETGCDENENFGRCGSMAYFVGGAGLGRELSESLRPPTFTVKVPMLVMSTPNSRLQNGGQGTH